MHIYARARSLFFIKNVFVKLTLFFDAKKEIHQTKIILFCKSTFKMNLMLGRTIFLILLTLAVTPFKFILTLKVGLICILLLCILFFCNQFLPLMFASCFKIQYALHITTQCFSVLAVAFYYVF